MSERKSSAIYKYDVQNAWWELGNRPMQLAAAVGPTAVVNPAQSLNESSTLGCCDQSSPVDIVGMSRLVQTEIVVTKFTNLAQPMSPDSQRLDVAMTHHCMQKHSSQASPEYSCCRTRCKMTNKRHEAKFFALPSMCCPTCFSIASAAGSAACNGSAVHCCR